MRKQSFLNYARLLPLVTAISLQLPAFAEEPAPAPLSAAVLDFKNSSEDLAEIGASISALLQVRLTIDSNAILVERAELGEILAEQELTLSGTVTPNQAAKVAQLTGAEVLISGRVFAIQDRIHIVAKIISATTSRVFGATAAYDRSKPIDAAVEKLGEDVAKMLQTKVTELRGGKSIQKQTTEKMEALFKGKPAKRVFVSIPETIIQVIVPDPAAQTEISRTLEEAGWEVVEKKDDADIIIRGKAFAETGMRRESLWFTRARLEFKVTTKGGKVLKTDRVVCGNVDLAQAVSAKGALQKAGLLAAPIVAKAWVESLKKPSK